MEPGPSPTVRYRTTIRTLMGITLVVGCWFGLYRIHPGLAWLLSGNFFLIAVSLAMASIRYLFWAPLTVTIGWLVLGFTPLRMWLVDPCFNFSFLGASAIGICALTIDRTLRHYRGRDRPERVVLSAILVSTIAGFCTGLMYSIPLCIAAGLDAPVFRYPEQFSIWPDSIAVQILGTLLGLGLGLGLGFICDLCVNLKYRNRKQVQPTFTE